MLEIFYSPVFWIVLIAIILVVIYYHSNYRLLKKKDEEASTSNTNNNSSTSSSTSNTNKSSTSSSTSSSSSPFSPSEESYSYSSESYVTPLPESEENQCEDFQPWLPPHVSCEGDYKPEFFYSGSGKPSKGETECKRAAEEIFGVPFNTIRPDWLRNRSDITGLPENEKKRNMEIDCYYSDDKYKIGIEYHGEQHYKYIPFFHKRGRIDFTEQVRRDHLKLELCKQHGVSLIIVPYNVPHNKIADFIRYYDPRAIDQRDRLAKLS